MVFETKLHNWLGFLYLSCNSCDSFVCHFNVGRGKITFISPVVQAKKKIASFSSILLFLLTLQSTQLCLVSLICSHWCFESFLPPIYLCRHWPYLDYQLLLPKLDLPLTKLLLQIFSCSNQRGFSKTEIWTSLIKNLQFGYRKKTKQNKQKSSEVLGTELQVFIIWLLPFKLRL